MVVSSCLQVVFGEVGSGSCIHSQLKLLDVVARLSGCAGEMSDAVKAYTQAKVEEFPELADTFIELLPDQWPASWKVQTSRVPIMSQFIWAPY